MTSTTSGSRLRPRPSGWNTGRPNRLGSAIIVMALLLVPMLAMVAFAVDYGYLLKVETDLQRCADAAVLACVQDLIPAADGSQDLDTVRQALRLYVTTNTDPGFQVLDADIEIGRYDPATIYSNVALLNTGVFDTVRVTLRRDAQANNRVALLFAPVLGISDSAVTATATAILQKPQILPPGADVLPFAVPEAVWDSHDIGDEWSIYGDGRIADNSGALVPGNWGTLDIGPTSNSTANLNDQITNGLNQTDLNALHSDGRIPTNESIDASAPVSMQADTGISSGLKQSVVPIHGQQRIVPIYDGNSGAGGNNLEFAVVKWGVVTVVDSNWQGNTNTRVVIEKAYDYQGELRPHGDLGATSGYVEGAYTTPVLVE